MIRRFIVWLVSLLTGRAGKARAFVTSHLQSGAVQVFVDSKARGVHVPVELCDADGRILLNLSYRFRPPAYVVCDDRGVRALLLFVGVNREVSFPWRAVLSARPLGPIGAAGTQRRLTVLPGGVK